MKQPFKMSHLEKWNQTRDAKLEGIAKRLSADDREGIHREARQLAQEGGEAAFRDVVDEALRQGIGKQPDPSAPLPPLNPEFLEKQTLAMIQRIDEAMAAIGKTPSN